MQPHTTVFKICRRCRQSLPRDSEHFGYANGTSGRLSYLCHQCAEKIWERLRDLPPLPASRSAAPTPEPASLAVPAPSPATDFHFDALTDLPGAVPDGRPAGYVYVIASANGPYKIGRTANLKRRFAGFQTLPLRLRVVHWIECEDCCEAEGIIHNYFARRRITGEWFALRPSDVQALSLVRFLPAFTDTSPLRDIKTLGAYCQILPTDFFEAVAYVLPGSTDQDGEGALSSINEPGNVSGWERLLTPHAIAAAG